MPGPELTAVAAADLLLATLIRCIQGVLLATIDLSERLECETF